MAHHLPEPAGPSGGALPTFVGRERELAILRERLAAALRSEGGIALSAGEPGIGKPRLAQVLASEAEGAGAKVLWGRAYEGDWSPAFGPWVEALGDDLTRRSPEWVRTAWERLGPGAALLAQLLPAARAAVPA